MNELLIYRLRTARINKNMKQQEVADILGIKPNTLSNWEKGRTEPDIDTFVKLCDIYELDCASLLADVYAFTRIQSDISLAEYEIIKKYRALDEHGKKNVNNILNNEYERCTALSEGQICLSFSDDHELDVIENGKRVPYVMEIPNVKAAHNDHADEPGELEKMQEDISNLKRP